MSFDQSIKLLENASSVDVFCEKPGEGRVYLHFGPMMVSISKHEASLLSAALYLASTPEKDKLQAVNL